MGKLKLVFFILTCINTRADHISLATLHWPPYIGEQLKNKGIIGDIITRAFESQGHKVTFVFMPWSRSILEVKEGRIDGLLPVYKTTGREKNNYFSSPILSGPITIYKRKDQKIQYRSHKDLAQYTLGLVRGYKNTKEIDQSNNIRKSYTSNDLSNLKKLIKKRVDLVIIDKYVAEYLIKTHLKQYKNKISLISPILGKKGLYAQFPKKYKRSKKLQLILNKGIKKIQNEIPNIVKEHLSTY